MGNIYIALNGDDVGSRIGDAIANDDHESLAAASSAIDGAHNSISDWVQQVGGRKVTSTGDEGIYVIPEEHAGELENLRDQYKETSGHGLTVGVGSSMSEASKALIYGKLNGKNQVVHYEPQIEDYLSDEDEEEIPSKDKLTAQAKEDNEAEEGEVEEAGELDPDAESEEDTDGEPQEPGDEAADSEQEMPSSTDDPDSSLGDPKGKPSKGTPPMAAGKQIPGKDEPSEDGGDEDTDADPEDQELDQSSDPDQEQAADKQALPPQKAGVAGDPKSAGPQQPTDAARPPMASKNPDAPGSQAIDGDIDGEDFGANEITDDPNDPSKEVEDKDDVQDSNDPNVQPSAPAQPDPMTAIPPKGKGEIKSDSIYQDLSGEDVASGDDSQEQDSSADPNAQSDQYNHNDALADMIHGDMEAGDPNQEQDPNDPSAQPPQEGEEGQEEDSSLDDELRGDIATALMAFKENKEMLESAREQNPKLYQATLTMLRSMIEMAKKLGYAPEKDMQDQEGQQQLNEEFPAADEGQEEGNEEQDPNVQPPQDKKGPTAPKK